MTDPARELDTAPRQSRNDPVVFGEIPESNPKCKVLYIEDNPASLRLMDQVIEHLGIVDLMSAHTAEIGLAMAKVDRPDLILMDINLPGMDGFVALQKLKTIKETEDLPVIAVNADAMASEIQRAKEAGFKGYIQKPFQIDELIAEISANLPKQPHVN